jgi:hypothetical protein
LTASATIRRLDELLDDGFRVIDVSSTWEHVTVDLARAEARATVELDRDDARALLGSEEPTRSRAVAAGRGP